MSKLTKRDPEKEALAPRASPLLRPSLFEEIDALFREPWRPWFSPLFRVQEIATTPAIDVFEESGSVVVKAELPGLKKEDIDIEIEGDVLTISGKKEKEEKVERKNYYRYERAAGAFSRSVTLPVEVEPGQIKAELKNGVLEVRAPKKAGAEPKTKKIPIE